MSILDRVPARLSADDNREFAFEECDWSTEFPGLWEFIARRRYQGNPRSGGRVLLYSENGKLCVCLMDRASGQVAFYAADSVSDGLQGVEASLQSGKLDWRRDKRSR